MMELPELPEPFAWRVRRHDAPDYWIIFMHQPVDALRDPEREVQTLYTQADMLAMVAAAVEAEREANASLSPNGLNISAAAMPHEVWEKYSAAIRARSAPRTQEG